MGSNARTGSTPVPSTQREEFSFLSFFCGYMNVWTTTTLLLCCCLCHLTCKHVNVTNNITWLRHCPHSAARLRCAHLMAVAVFLRIMCAKATATIASYRSTPVPSTQREEFSFLSFFVLWRVDMLKKVDVDTWTPVHFTYVSERCPTKLYQRVIRNRERAETTETTEKKVIPDFVVVPFVSVVSVVPKKDHYIVVKRCSLSCVG